MGMNKGENDLSPRDQGLWVALLELALKGELDSSWEAEDGFRAVNVTIRLLLLRTNVGGLGAISWLV